MRNPVTIAGQEKLILSQQLTASAAITALPVVPQPLGGQDPNVGSRPAEVEKVVLQADPGNAANNVLIGTAAAQNFALVAGASIILELNDPTQISYVASAGSPKLNVLYFGH